MTSRSRADAGHYHPRAQLRRGREDGFRTYRVQDCREKGYTQRTQGLFLWGL